jgi:GT2 family glycosyltransferase
MANMLVSVLVLNYNQSHWICEALDSILEQDYTEKELLIMDDGSEDASCAIIEDWISKKWPEALFIKNERNTGNISLNMNRLLGLAKGEYIAINAADDRMRPGRIRTQIECIKKNRDVVLVFGGAHLIDEDSKSLGQDIFSFEKGFKGDLLPFLLGHNCVPTCTSLFRRDTALKIGGFDESLYLEDYDMWLRLASIGPSMSVDQVISDYRRVRGTSVSIGSTDRMHHSAEESLIKFCRNTHLRAPYRAIAARSLVSIMIRRVERKAHRRLPILKALQKIGASLELIIALVIALPMPLGLRKRLISRMLSLQMRISMQSRSVSADLLLRSDFWRNPGFN